MVFSCSNRINNLLK